MTAVFNGAFQSSEDNFGGKRPVVFDILGTDYETSLLPEGIKMILHVNPSSMSFSPKKEITRIQTRGGWVEQHWGDAVGGISFDAASGGFMRLFSGLSNITNPAFGGTRRETLAYDRYLDFLALFDNNGVIYDQKGEAVLNGQIKCSFDGSTYFGWFSSFSVTEDAEKPYLFNLSASFEVDKENHILKSTFTAASNNPTSQTPETVIGTTPIIF